MQKIPLHIISGFLGSGKTTLLKNIIYKYADSVKIGVIQNEFAPAGIDGVVLRETGKNFNLLEIKNGSIFCICLMSTFTRSLERLIDEHRPEVIIVESSGLSDTTSMAESLTSGNLTEKIFLATNWCIVDALNFSKTGIQKQRVCHQLRMADVVIINKTDLAANKTDYIKTEISKINPFAEIRESTFCTVDLELGKVYVNKVSNAEQKPLSRPDINSMVIKSRKKIMYESLKTFLENWSPKAYRIKGFVNLSGGKTVAVQCIFGSVEIKETENSFQNSEIVALTEQFTLREWNRAFSELK